MRWLGTPEQQRWDQGEMARRVHSQWLTAALQSEIAYPRIPVRRADAGGWDELLAKPNGHAITERWWRRVLARIGL
jgi:transposase